MSLATIGSNVSHMSKSLRRAGWWVWWYCKKVNVLKENRKNSPDAHERYQKAVGELGKAVSNYTFLMKQVNGELVKINHEFKK